MCVKAYLFNLKLEDNHMNWKQEFSRWLSYAELDAELKEQLENMKQDEKKSRTAFIKI